MRCSNSLLGILNTITFILSIPILGGGIWLSLRNTADHYFDKGVIVIGVFLMLVSLGGLIGSSCRVNWVLWVYLFVMFILIVILFAFTIFAFVVTNKGAGNFLSNRGYKDFRLGDYSHWLQKRVDDPKNWKHFRSTLFESKICQKLADKNAPQDEFYSWQLNPLESGCCKPPEECEFKYVGPTNWTKTGTRSNPDCNGWDNNPNTLCYDCTSCKAGFLQTIKVLWKKVAVINIVVIVFLIIVYSIGCCAVRNNRLNNAHQWKGYR